MGEICTDEKGCVISREYDDDDLETVPLRFTTPRCCLRTRLSRRGVAPWIRRLCRTSGLVKMMEEGKAFVDPAMEMLS